MSDFNNVAKSTPENIRASINAQKEQLFGTHRQVQIPPPPAETRMPQHAPLRAQVMGVYPTLDSLQDAIDLAKSKLPITSENELMALLYTYHNTLLAQVQANHKGQ